MPRVVKPLEDSLRPYIFHGVDLTWRDGDKEALAECPWCGREGKFSVDIETGQWRCFVCNESGNASVFLRCLWNVSDERTKDYRVLSESRGLLYPETLVHWALVQSITTNNWLVPGYGADGKLNQLYKCVIVHDKLRLLPTPTLKHQLHGVNLYDSKKSTVCLCEGVWDAMSLWEMLGQVKQDGDVLKITANRDRSLLAGCNVLAVPGCNVFRESWIPLFSDKVVNLLYDNDYPHEHPRTGKRIAPAGLSGMERVSTILGAAENPPAEVNYLRWGKDKYSLSMPNGADIRDLPDLLEGK